MTYAIRTARNSDLAQATDLWRLARPHDDVQPRALSDFIDKSDLYRPETVLVAETDGRIIGFIIGIVCGEKEGSIPLFFVHPECDNTEVADALLAQVLCVWQREGFTVAKAETAWDIGLSDCGYDARYLDAIAAFSRNGFTRVWSDEELDVDIVKDLRDFEIPRWISDARGALEADGITFGPCEPEMRQRYLEFMLEHFGAYAGWCAGAKQYVDRPQEPEFHLLAFRDKSIVGFTECVFEGDWRIDATGVREDLRRRKIGSVLVFLALDEVRRRGCDRMCIGEAPPDFYKVVDGQILRRYMIMHKDLENG